ncbi:protein FAM177A1 [Alligator mississippiensis]|uniref:protein FAM177A1 n=1 Tax=Alligator mississippiensis TaxID=8496 RepID=UPI00287766BA|nr:protein FAM177A1 [Alligator mississippiensis]
MEQRLSAITLYCAPAAAPRAMEQEQKQQHSNGDRGFENVELGIIGKKKKIPRRVIHFASGETMEEYSTDEEEDEQEKKDLLPPIDPRQYCKVCLPDVSAVLLPVKLAVAMLSVLKLSFLITSGKLTELVLCKKVLL